jgi:D-hexose-6-phosphate mutarotase
MTSAVELTAGPSGLAVVRLNGPSGSSSEIYQHGAHVTSWVSRDKERLYLSPTAMLDGSKAIRGGIPICFPQFGTHGPLQQHGFARNSNWALVQGDDEDCDESASPRVQFVLSDSAVTRESAWGYRFKFILTVELISPAGDLRLQMDVTNIDEASFDFTTALHCYFAVPDSQTTTVAGLAGVTYSDKVNSGKEVVDAEDEVAFEGKEVDRVYCRTSDDLSIPAASVSLTKTNLPEAVVWNPWIYGAAALKDIPDDGYSSFVCVEPARVREKAIVLPGQTWTASLTLRVGAVSQ